MGMIKLIDAVLYLLLFLCLNSLMILNISRR